MKPFTTLAAILFTLVAVLHVLRFALGWQASLNGMTVPMWVSLPAAVVAAGLAWMLWREAHK